MMIKFRSHEFNGAMAGGGATASSGDGLSAGDRGGAMAGGKDTRHL
jgi:hypothetical protein